MRIAIPLLAALATACGPGLACGAGTEEVDGVCVAVGTDGTDGTDGTNTTGAGPQVVITPPLVDFGQVGVGCTESAALAVSNGGEEAIVIDELLFPTAGTALSLDAATLPSLPMTLEPGEVLDLRIVAAPSAAGPEDARLVVGTDPDRVVTAEVTVEGTVDTLTDTFVAAPPAIDVMLLIDHSCSMEDQHFDEVATGIATLVDTLDLLGDWQLAEVTLDTGCANLGVVDASTPNVVGELVAHAFDGAGGPVGVYLTEALLELASIALAKTDPGECNEGFLRPGAALYVLVVSDEQEQSGTPAADHVADFQGYVPGVVVSAVADVNRNCGDGSGDGGYREAVVATVGSLLNICGAWGPDAGDLLTGAPVASEQTVTLSQPATAPPVEVLVGGVPTVDFTWDAALNQVTVHDDLAEGTPIDVTYPVAPTCAP